MKIIVNQKLLVFDDKMSLEGLLENLAIPKKYMAVEINEIIIPKSEYIEYQLKDGDVVEIINAVGGG